MYSAYSVTALYNKPNLVYSELGPMSESKTNLPLCSARVTSFNQTLSHSVLCTIKVKLVQSVALKHTAGVKATLRSGSQTIRAFCF